MPSSTRSKIVILHADNNSNSSHEELGALQEAASRAHFAAVRLEDHTSSLRSLRRSAPSESSSVLSEASSGDLSGNIVAHPLWSGSDESSSISGSASKNGNASSPLQDKNVGEMVFLIVPKKKGKKRQSLPGAVTRNLHKATVHRRNSVGPGIPSRSDKKPLLDRPESQPIDSSGPPQGPFRRRISSTPIAEGILQTPLPYHLPSIPRTKQSAAPLSSREFKRLQSEYYLPGAYVPQVPAAMANAFQSEIFPIIQKACFRFRDMLSAEVLYAIGKSCTTEVMSSELQTFLKQNHYRLNKSWKKVVSSAIDRLLEKEAGTDDVSQAEELSAMPPMTMMAPVATMVSKASTVSKLSSIGSSRPNVSLLGPEQASSIKGPATAVSDSYYSRTQRTTSPTRSLEPIRNLDTSGLLPEFVHDYVSNEASDISSDRNKRAAVDGVRAPSISLGDNSLTRGTNITKTVHGEHFPEVRRQENDASNTSRSSYGFRALSHHKKQMLPENHQNKSPEKINSGQIRFIWPALPRSPLRAQDLIHHVPNIRASSTASLLRQRELGLGRLNSSSLKALGISAHIRHQTSEKLTYWRDWTGVSKDVLTVAWSPNGSTFVVGGSTDLDNLNLQYNRPNNLLFGDLDSNTLIELPDHQVARPKPETIEYGDNSRQAVYDSVDSELYTTITSVTFDIERDRMYSASYDKTVKIWDVAQKNVPTCFYTLQHDAPVDHLAVSKDYPIFATGQMATDQSIRIYESSQHSPFLAMTFTSPRASKLNVHPTGLQLGIAPEVNKLLLAGFMANKGDDSMTGREGDLCLWNLETGNALKVHPAAQSVFDVSWHPNLPVFAAATTPSSSRNLTDRFHTRSVIRTFRPLQAPGRIMEYECPASDINDVKFHPFDDNYISAGCTNGVTYFYDYRMPDRILHKLHHGPVIDQLDGSRTREEQDTGVRLSLWDQDGQLFYTGSSDGVIKAWNIYGSTDDAFVRDVAHFDSAVMCGAFSPDYNNLLVGLAKGAVQVLSSAPTTHPLDQIDDDFPSPPKGPYETMTYIPAKQPSTTEEPSGIALSRELVASGKLTIHPTYGAGQGPLYNGPYAAYAHPKEEDPSVTSLIPDIRSMQLDKHERKQGQRAGGQVSREDKVRYRDQKKLAHARNFLWYGVEKSRERAKESVSGGGGGRGAVLAGKKRKRSRSMKSEDFWWL